MASKPSSESRAIVVASRSLMPESRAIRRAVETFQTATATPTASASRSSTPKAASGPAGDSGSSPTPES